MDEPKPDKRAEVTPERRPGPTQAHPDEARRMIEDYAADLRRLIKKFRLKTN